MLPFLFLRCMSDNYEAEAKTELGSDYPKTGEVERSAPLAHWYADNLADVPRFERQTRRKLHYLVQPQHLWSSIAHMAGTQHGELLNTLPNATATATAWRRTSALFASSAPTWRRLTVHPIGLQHPQSPGVWRKRCPLA